VLRALALGDLLCAVPALRALRRAWPSAEIALIGLPGAREFAARFSHYIDRFIEFPGYPGLPEREPHIAALPEFFTALQRAPFDLVLQLHGSGRFVNEIVALAAPRQSAGFYLPGDFVPGNELYCLWPNEGLEIHRLLALVDFLGLPRAGDDLEFPLGAADFAALAELSTEIDFTAAPYVVVHPGASVRQRRWPAASFAAVADALAERGLTVVLTGIANEQPIAAEVAGEMQHPCLNLCGRTNLGTLGALVARAALVLCNDTGVSHVAAATRTPSVVISTGKNPARWAPVDRMRHRVLCRPAGPGVAEVWRAAERLVVVRHGSTAPRADENGSLEGALTPAAAR
jgi:ADP-heptose:LPS heptosyltransferase